MALLTPISRGSTRGAAKTKVTVPDALNLALTCCDAPQATLEDWNRELRHHFRIIRCVHTPSGLAKARLRFNGSHEPEFGVQSGYLLTDDNNHAVHWLFLVECTATGKTLRIGPTDVRSLFPHLELRIRELERERSDVARSNSVRLSLLRSAAENSAEYAEHVQCLRLITHVGDPEGVRIQEVWEAGVKNHGSSAILCNAFHQQIGVLRQVLDLARREKVVVISPGFERDLEHALGRAESGLACRSEDLDTLVEAYTVVRRLAYSLHPHGAKSEDTGPLSHEIACRIKTVACLTDYLSSFSNETFVLDYDPIAHPLASVMGENSSVRVVTLYERDLVYRTSNLPDRICGSFTRCNGQPGNAYLAEASTDLALSAVLDNRLHVVVSPPFDRLNAAQKTTFLLSALSFASRDGERPFTLCIPTKNGNGEPISPSIRKLLGLTRAEFVRNLGCIPAHPDHGEAKLLSNIVNDTAGIFIYTLPSPSDLPEDIAHLVQAGFLRNGSARVHWDGSNDSSLSHAFDPSRAVSALTASSIQVRSCKVVPRDVIHGAQPYRSFDEALTALLWISRIEKSRSVLSQQDRERINRIRVQWDSEAPYLSVDDVIWVLQRAANTKISYGLLGDNEQLKHNLHPLLVEKGEEISEFKRNLEERRLAPIQNRHWDTRHEYGMAIKDFERGIDREIARHRAALTVTVLTLYHRENNLRFGRKQPTLEEDLGRPRAAILKAEVMNRYRDAEIAEEVITRNVLSGPAGAYRFLKVLGRENVPQAFLIGLVQYPGEGWRNNYYVTNEELNVIGESAVKNKAYDIARQAKRLQGQSSDPWIREFASRTKERKEECYHPALIRRLKRYYARGADFKTRVTLNSVAIELGTSEAPLLTLSQRYRKRYPDSMVFGFPESGTRKAQLVTPELKKYLELKYHRISNWPEPPEGYLSAKGAVNSLGTTYPKIRAAIRLVINDVEFKGQHGRYKQPGAVALHYYYSEPMLVEGLRRYHARKTGKIASDNGA